MFRDESVVYPQLNRTCERRKPYHIDNIVSTRVAPPPLGNVLPGNYTGLLFREFEGQRGDLNDSAAIIINNERLHFYLGSVL